MRHWLTLLSVSLWMRRPQSTLKILWIGVLKLEIHIPYQSQEVPCDLTRRLTSCPLSEWGKHPWVNLITFIHSLIRLLITHNPLFMAVLVNRPKLVTQKNIASIHIIFTQSLTPRMCHSSSPKAPGAVCGAICLLLHFTLLECSGRTWGSQCPALKLR